MMTKDEFKHGLAEDVKNYLAMEEGIDVNVSFKQVEKLNEGILEGIVITPVDSNVGCTFYIDKPYEAYQKGENYSDIFRGASHFVLDGIKIMPKVNTENLMDYETMKDRLTMQVVSTADNQEKLSSIPHRELEDMSIVYRFLLSSTEQGTQTVLITNEMMEKFGITEEQLHQDALISSPKIKPAEIKGIIETLIESMGKEQAELMGIEAGDDQMFVASVPDKVQGAGILAYEEFMEKAAERVGGNFYILPSSIHEVILVPETSEVDLEALEGMVREVNATQVAPEEKLTDNVYHYDTKEKIFETGQKYLDRTKDLEKEEPDVER